MKIGLSLLIIIFSGTITGIHAQQTGIHFEDELSWKQVLKKAKKEHKYVFVDCYASWCGPCKMMDKDVYSKETVGAFMGKNFISVKVQCDSTKTDDDRIKSWYRDAHIITTRYNVDAYPTLLFFSADGKLVHKGIGFQEENDFKKLAGNATDPSKQYYTLVRKYEDGKMSYEEMPAFAKMARRFPNEELYTRVTRDYIHNYADKLHDDHFFARSNVEMLSQYAQNINSSDASFKRLMMEPEKGDAAMGQKGYSFGILSSVIYTEMITPEIRTAKNNESTPDWEGIKQAIGQRYGRMYAAKNVVKAKMRWYQEKKDTLKLCRAAVERIELSFADSTTNGAYNAATLNEFAWNIFQMSGDREQLEKALIWSDLSLKTLEPLSPLLGVFTDTKANLLYKLGKRQEAITLDEQALALVKNAKNLNPAYITDIEANYNKMKEDKPTW